MPLSPDSGQRTRAIHAAGGPDPTSGAILTPIVQSSTFVQDAVGEHKGFAYSRVSNPTVSALERVLGSLEDAPPSVAFSSGLSAETTLFLATLRAGDHAVVTDGVYGGTIRLFQQLLSGLGVESTFVDTTHAEHVAAALRPNTRLVFVESPGNPTLRLADIRAISAVARSAGALLVVDNTFLTPALQRPLDLGADVSLYSTTKHIEGHNATIGGAITTRDVALLERLRFVRKSLGTIQSPFEAWLTLRGLKTLPLRMREHSASALTVARWLQAHPCVTRVSYPGLRSFPQAALAASQHLGGHGGVVSIEVAGGLEGALGVMNAVRLFSRAESVGAVESLITHSASMTHADVSREQRLAAGLPDGLIRLSVGLEDVGDLIADLEQALEHAARFAGATVDPGVTNAAEERSEPCLTAL